MPLSHTPLISYGKVRYPRKPYLKLPNLRCAGKTWGIIKVRFAGFGEAILNEALMELMSHITSTCPGIFKATTGGTKIKVARKLTLNRSPFVNKKSKDQFELRVFRRNTYIFVRNMPCWEYCFRKINQLLADRHRNVRSLELKRWVYVWDKKRYLPRSQWFK